MPYGTKTVPALGWAVRLSNWNRLTRAGCVESSVVFHDATLLEPRSVLTSSLPLIPSRRRPLTVGGPVNLPSVTTHLAGRDCRLGRGFLSGSAGETHPGIAGEVHEYAG